MSVLDSNLLRTRGRSEVLSRLDRTLAELSTANAPPRAGLPRPEAAAER